MNKDTLKDIILLLLGGVLAIAGFLIITHALLSVNKQATTSKQQTTVEEQQETIDEQQEKIDKLQREIENKQSAIDILQSTINEQINSTKRNQRTLSATITRVDNDGTTQLTDITGNVWIIIDDEYQRGERVSILFDTMGTPQVEDDEIVSVSRS